LAVQDAANREWQFASLRAQLKGATLLRAAGDVASAASRTTGGCSILRYGR
ncbi:MAG: hypothetical protein HY736_02180, partial [Verrucomicrobia bacterium]|nr:hypothetical protein [Verrucomicrobiota bacterium]